MAKESFLLYHGYYEPVKNLSLEDKGLLFDAIFQFSISGIEPTNTSRIFMAFQFFKNQMVQDAKKYDRTVERNRKNGLKGGRPENPKNPVGLKKPKKADTDTDTDTDTVTVTDTVTDTVTVNGNVNDKSTIENFIFRDEIFIKDLTVTNKGKDLKKAWEQCWLHFSQLPNGLHDWEWKQKYAAWVARMKPEKNGKDVNGKTQLVQ